MGDLHELWALPLEEQQRRRKYGPWGHLREIQLAKENAAPDFPRVGRFYIFPHQTDGFVLVDPKRPWNDAVIFSHREESVVRQYGESLK